LTGYLGATCFSSSGIGFPDAENKEGRGEAFWDQKILKFSGQSCWLKIGGIYTSIFKLEVNGWAAFNTGLLVLLGLDRTLIDFQDFVELFSSSLPEALEGAFDGQEEGGGLENKS
jgi:hypothetical protein